MKKKYFIYLVTIILIIFIGLIMFRQDTEKKVYEKTDFFMDTIVDIKIVGHDDLAHKALAETVKEMKYWYNRLNRFNETSDIYTINTSNDWVYVNEEIIDIIKSSIYYGDLTNGAFDITITPLMNLWGFTQENKTHQIPTTEEISEALNRVNYQEIKIDESTNRIFLPANMKIDLGGVAKGYIVDKGIEKLKELGIKSAFINAGGDIRVIGQKDADNPWRIGIQQPRNINEIYTDYIIGLNKGSIATSGDYERYFERDSIRYSHLIDPKTAYPAQELQSVSIYALTTMEADILSTAVFILGWEKGQELINSLADVEGFIVKENEIWVSPGFEELIVR